MTLQVNALLPRVEAAPAWVRVRDVRPPQTWPAQQFMTVAGMDLACRWVRDWAITDAVLLAAPPVLRGRVDPDLLVTTTGVSVFLAENLGRLRGLADLSLPLLDVPVLSVVGYLLSGTGEITGASLRASVDRWDGHPWGWLGAAAGLSPAEFEAACADRDALVTLAALRGHAWAGPLVGALVGAGLG